MKDDNIDKWRLEVARLMTSLATTGEMEELLEALLTPGEFDELARRWQIVKMLLEGTKQREIQTKLNVSIATVTRGSREVKYGKGTFQKYYERMHKQK